MILNQQAIISIAYFIWMSRVNLSSYQHASICLTTQPTPQSSHPKGMPLTESHAYLFSTAHSLKKISFSPTFMCLPWRLCSWLVHIAYQYNGFSNRHASKIKGVSLVCILHIVYQNNVIIPMDLPMQWSVHPYFAFCM